MCNPRTPEGLSNQKKLFQNVQQQKSYTQKT